MRKLTGVRILAVIVALIGVGLCSYYVIAAESGKEAINKELQKGIGMPVMSGEFWQKMTDDSKISFIWGLWNVIAIENYLMDKYPDLKRDNFSLKVREGVSKSPKTMNETVALVDNYYQDNPDHLDKPVVGVLWALEIKPNLTTGIAGRPLNPNN